MTCSDRRKSLEGPGIAYQAISLRSSDVQLENWSLIQKKTIIDALVSMTSLNDWNDELDTPFMRDVRKEIVKNPTYTKTMFYLALTIDSPRIRGR